MGKIVKKGSRWCIVATNNGRVGRCFGSRNEAVKALAALRKKVAGLKKR
jgi:hypothetical protein